MELLTKKDQDWETKLKEALKKPPTTEIGTQTDLTAEQISQMERDLAEKNNKVNELQESLNDLTNQSNQKENEINQLNEQAKDLEPNPTERKLMDNYTSKLPIYPISAVERARKELISGKIGGEVWDWKQLREVYSEIRKRTIRYTDVIIDKIKLSEKLEKEVEIRNQLQTKYDLEVRSKEEVVRELQKEKGWWDKWVRDESEKWIISSKDDGKLSSHDWEMKLSFKFGSYSVPTAIWVSWYPDGFFAGRKAKGDEIFRYAKIGFQYVIREHYINQ